MSNEHVLHTYIQSLMSVTKKMESNENAAPFIIIITAKLLHLVQVVATDIISSITLSALTNVTY